MSIFTVSTADIYNLALLKHNIYCVLHPPIWFAGPVGIFDTIMGVVCYWLFYRKMKILTNTLRESSIPENGATRTRSMSQAEQTCDYELAYILRKYAILSGTTAISTWIAAGSSIFIESPQGLFAIDTVINTWCILLYNGRYDGVYNKIFGCISNLEWKNKNKGKTDIAMEKESKPDTISSKTGTISTTINTLQRTRIESVSVGMEVEEGNDEKRIENELDNV